jgi:predicted enzyme related to lactoylglutathione lyase
MLTPIVMLPYVDHPGRSAAFYAALLGAAPVESPPTFPLFAFLSGVRVGLWSRHAIEPAPAAGPGAAQVAFVVEDVDAVHAGWRDRGLSILQAPVDLDFGRTCVVLDPDGHRLRVFTPA